MGPLVRPVWWRFVRRSSLRGSRVSKSFRNTERRSMQNWLLGRRRSTSLLNPFRPLLRLGFVSYYSQEYGYLGDKQIQFLAEK